MLPGLLFEYKSNIRYALNNMTIRTDSWHSLLTDEARLQSAGASDSSVQQSHCSEPLMESQ